MVSDEGFEFEVVTFQDRFFLDTARTLAELAAGLQHSNDGKQRDRQMACTVGAIMSAISSLECTINGIFEHAADSVSGGHRPTNLQKLMASLWTNDFDRLPMLNKFRVALALAKKQDFDVSKEPFQSVQVLVRLRNSIAHPQEILASKEIQKKLEQSLRGRFKIVPPEPHRREFFPARCLTPECADWAFISTARFLDAFQKRMPPRSFPFGRWHEIPKEFL
jgi:hypothetical protein